MPPILWLNVCMPFKAQQLPFLEYREAVRAKKRELDRSAKSSYPMTVTTTDTNDQVLMEEVFKNVWDRKPKWQRIAENDWEAPVKLTFSSRDGEQLGVVWVEQLHAKSLGTGYVQLSCEDYMKEE
jgi:hypothetical protein